MSTGHEYGAEKLLDRMMDHQGASRTLAETRRRFKLPADHPGAFGDEYTAVIGQTFRVGPANWPMEQMAAFTAVHTKICVGEVLQVLIGGADTDGGPFADKRRDDNAAKLADLPEPFQAEVDRSQNGADYDGTLKWHAPIQMDGATDAVFLPPCSRAMKQPLAIVSTVSAGWAPLEIGYTMPSRTMLHLLQHGSVARWPYGSDTIRLLVRKDGPVEPHF